ncbi:MAG: hypothetical protein HOM84_00235 [Thiotrichales bacterium]|jgi:hypothetical protein|nr:hypothetical protein [Thiotrichales bacterium]
MEIEKESKVFKVLFKDLLYPKEFIFAKDMSEAKVLVERTFASRKIISIERIELCG